MYLKTLCVLTLLACTLPAHADGTAPPLYKTGTLTADISGPDVSMQLRLPMTRGPGMLNDGKLAPTTAEVVAILKDAAKLFVFPDKASCKVESANAFAVDPQGKPTTAEGNIQAMYRFHCDGVKGSIDKLGIRFAEQLRGLEKLKLQASTEKGEITQELSPPSGDVPL